VFAPRAGWPLLASGGALGIAAAVLGATGRLDAPALPVVLLLLAGGWGFLAQFFRDPERAAGAAIVAPADGRVRLVQREGPFLRIAVFMNVTDVHVNRFPLDARVEAVGAAGRGHAPAYRPDARGNVQREYRLATSLGEVRVVQITGILARRLVSFVSSGERRRKGERLGMIVLGSRVDLLLPAERVEPRVRVGDRVRAGVTTVARERP
jgi:phosphatidylserine decarboxylase